MSRGELVFLDLKKKEKKETKRRRRVLRNPKPRISSFSATSFDTPSTTSSAYQYNDDLDGSTVHAFHDDDYGDSNPSNDLGSDKKDSSEAFHDNGGSDEDNDSEAFNDNDEHFELGEDEECYEDHDESSEDLNKDKELEFFFKKYNLSAYLQSKTGASLTLNVATTYQNYFLRFFKWWENNRTPVEDASTVDGKEDIPELIIDLFNNIDIVLNEYVTNILEAQDGLAPKTCLNTITGKSINLSLLNLISIYCTTFFLFTRHQNYSSLDFATFERHQKKNRWILPSIS